MRRLVVMLVGITRVTCLASAGMARSAALAPAGQIPSFPYSAPDEDVRLEP